MFKERILRFRRKYTVYNVAHSYNIKTYGKTDSTKHQTYNHFKSFKKKLIRLHYSHLITKKIFFFFLISKKDERIIRCSKYTDGNRYSIIKLDYKFDHKLDFDFDFNFSFFLDS